MHLVHFIGFNPTYGVLEQLNVLVSIWKVYQPNTCPPDILSTQVSNLPSKVQGLSKKQVSLNIAHSFGLPYQT